MAKNDQSKRRPSPPQKLIPDEYAREALEVDEVRILNDRISELANLLWRHENMDEGERNVRIARAIEHYNSLKPTDGAEGMLAQQMVGTHFAALECLRRAALPNQTFEGRDMALKHAHKLMTLYARQLETLNKHRGKGQQKVTVEHVRVEKGGQAIVGTVEAGNRAPDLPQTDALEHQPEESVPLDLPKKAKAKRGKRS
ncbi:MAG: hypothetical protein JJ901_11820 [Erythrobacter sp.]|uniref:hypothetical protein n=1 Tax=Erythrobacter sp. TaxID=1042 RepID=UPI001B0721C2|nr:hypothetical protein [Erythrobacter sp.]MBO6768971.1 hypothetical protein [Erythrobacter sp.]